MFALFLGVIISLGLFGSMEAMTSNNQEPLKNTESLQMTEFIKLKKLNKEVESKRELPKEEPPPPPPPPEQQKPIEQKPLPEMEIPTLDIPQPELLTSSDIQLAVVKKPKPKPKIKVKVKAKAKVKVKAKVKKHVKKVAHKIISSVTQVKPTKIIAKKPIKVVVKQPVKVAKPKMSNKVYSNVRATHRVDPKYPRRALRRKQKGWVKVQFIITASGKVKSPFVVSSKPSGVFDKEALKAIRRWKFKARIVNGQAVAQKAVQTIKFKLR